MHMELRLALGISRFCNEDFFPVYFPQKSPDSPSVGAPAPRLPTRILAKPFHACGEVGAPDTASPTPKNQTLVGGGRLFEAASLQCGWECPRMTPSRGPGLPPELSGGAEGSGEGSALHCLPTRARRAARKEWLGAARSLLSGWRPRLPGHPWGGVMIILLPLRASEQGKKPE